MVDTQGQFVITEGDDVYGSDDEKVGSVVSVQPNYVVVEKGFFFPTDYYIPATAITTVNDGKVYLSVSKDEALNQGWDTVPTDDYATTAGTVPTDDYATTAAAVPPADYDRDVDVARTDVVDQDVDTTRVAESDTLRVPVHEEELTATKRERQIGEVEIEKDVVTEEKVLEVPVTEERVRVERHVVDRAVGADDDAVFEEGTIEVPIRGEEVDLQKQVRVSEEVEVSKEAVQHTEEVAGTVRHEEVRIDEETVDVDSTANKRKR